MRSRLIQLGACLLASGLLVHCAAENSTSDDDDGGSSSGNGGASGSGKGGATSSGGVSTTAGTAGAVSSAGTSTGGSATGGTAGVSSSGTGGTVLTAGTSSGGSTPTAGTSSGGIGAGGVSTAGTTSTGGSSAGSATAGTGPIVDPGGIGLAKPGDEKSGSSEYLNLGDIRVINNKWGSDELGCNTQMRVFIQPDKTIGWDFNRQTCGGNAEKPDYPEIEFGVHPFGAGDALETSPPYSSTTLLPKKISEINTASVTIDNLNIALQNQKSWNTNLEFWISRKNPLEPGPEVHAELIVFWGWQDGRWPCDKTGNVTAGTNSYRLCHQDDNWADGRWRYYQFWVDNGPRTNYSGTVDVKALIDWLVNNYGLSRDYWITRVEVGSEIDDQTSGTVTVKNITFEVNGVSKSPVFGQ